MTKAIRLYDYQNDVLLRLTEAWRSHRSVMLQMPTGTGKTHVLAAVVKGFLSNHCGDIWIIAHRRELVTQAEVLSIRLPKMGLTIILYGWIKQIYVFFIGFIKSLTLVGDIYMPYWDMVKTWADGLKDNTLGQFIRRNIKNKLCVTNRFIIQVKSTTNK